MKESIKHLIDFKKVDALLEGFYKSTGFVTAILDLEANVLSQSGWRPICTEFHRVNPGTFKNCVISDTELANKMASGAKYHSYKCLNGLVDVAMPIMIEGEHVANLFSGQFFMEEPDKDSFLRQAKQFGFDEEKYLDALSKVPVVSEEKVKSAMDFLHDMTQFISEQAYRQKEVIDLTRQLRRNEKDLRESQRIAQIGSWRLDVETNQVFWTEELYNMYGFDPTVPPPPYTEHMKLFTPESWERLSTALASTVATGTSYTLELETIKKDGSNGWMWVHGEAIVDTNGKTTSLWGAAQEITNRKRAEEVLKENEWLLREANAQKDKFFSIIAHDLRSPFNSILGFSQLIVDQLKEKDYDGLDEYANILLQSSQRAMNLLVNLLEWTRSKTGRIEYNPEHFELVDFVEQTMPLFEDIARQKSISINLLLPSYLLVFADKHMINTVLRNLISNAVKFTRQGGEVTISAARKQGEVSISVKDNGVGISKNRIEKLFRIDESDSTKGTANEQGTGLGLILCKEFVEKHGGRIWVESAIDTGSAFTFTIPEKY